MMSSGLLIIDTQVALFTDKKAPLYKASEVLKTIQYLINEARKINIPILYIQHTETVGAFEKNSDGWQIHPSIAPHPRDYVIEKTSWDAFYKTSLNETLTTLGINHLIVTGMQTEYCLDTSLRCGYSNGMSFTVIEDAHTTVDAFLKAEEIITHHNRIWHNRFAQVIKSEFFKF